MIIILALLVPAIQSVLTASIADDLIISSPDGQVQGTTYRSDNNKTFYGFQGIPYATPPVGSLRFEISQKILFLIKVGACSIIILGAPGMVASKTAYRAPQPAQPWTGVWDATKDGNTCLSSLNFIYKAFESEDCLYINVYTPSLKPLEKLPVMVWIYGGSFVVGSSRKSEYGPDFLIEEDVIVVSFNYRLGAFGFLSTGDSAIVGNAGLKDQALAIKWAHDNVAFFGGDPDKITIFGESAGGASTGLQLVSPKAAGFYRAAIVESGSALTNFTIDLNPKAYADLLTTSLGGEEIILNGTQEMKKFLLEKSAEDILNAANLLAPKEVKGGENLLPKKQPWPVIEVENEDAFLTESPYELLDSGRFNQVPIIIGICGNEALMVFPDLETVQDIAQGYDTNPETIIPLNLRQNSSDNDIIIKTIQNMYLQEGETFSSNYVALSNYLSDNIIARGTIKQAELATKYVPVYLYQFSYYGRPIFPFLLPDAEKAGHGAELAFLFKTRDSNTTDPDDILTQNRMVKLWANFAKFLNPTPEQSELVDVKWPAVNATELQFLNINATLEVRAPIRGASYTGWTSIFETYGKKPLITF